MGRRHAWDWAATAYVVGLPCLWWARFVQDSAQAIAWPLATIALVGLTLLSGRGRPWAGCPPAVPWLLVAAAVTSAWHLPHGFGLALQGMMAYLGTLCLVRASPSAAWLEQRLVWLAGVNAAYLLVQLTGYDPLFDVPDSRGVGLFSRSNQLALLCLLGLALGRGWVRGAFLAAICWLGHWVAALAAPALIWRTGNRWLFVLAVVLVGCAVFPQVEAAWGMKVLPRLLVWQEAVGQALWSPLVGYGMGGYESLGSYGPIMYSGYVRAFHQGGIVLLLPLVALVRHVWRCPPSPARTALVLLAAAACVHDVWMFPRWIVVTMTLFAAVEIRRTDAN